MFSTVSSGKKKKKRGRSSKEDAAEAVTGRKGTSMAEKMLRFVKDREYGRYKDAMF